MLRNHRYRRKLHASSDIAVPSADVAAPSANLSASSTDIVALNGEYSICDVSQCFRVFHDVLGCLVSRVTISITARQSPRDRSNGAGIGDNSAEIGDDGAGIVDIAAKVISY